MVAIPARPHVVGRHRELAAVERLLDAACAGRGGLLVLTGPRGSGRTTMIDAAVALADDRGMRVVRIGSGPGMWVDLAAIGDVAPGLIVLDDIDRAGPDAAVRLSRFEVGSSAVLVTALRALGVPGDLRLEPLTAAEIAGALGVNADTAEALLLISSGLPGLARTFAAELRDGDPYVELAMRAPSRAEFLDVDDGLVRLIETAVERVGDDDVRARLLARLASELLGDTQSSPRRRALSDEALAAARKSGRPLTIAAVLDARLHALWDTRADAERLTAASEIVMLAQAARAPELERRGVFWQFVALMERGEVARATAALAAYSRAADAAGDDTARVVVTSRHAMLALVQGHYDEAVRLTDEVADLGRRVGVVDIERLTAALRGALGADRGGDPDGTFMAFEYLQVLARRMPGHFFEALTARTLAAVGRLTDAGVELERLLPRLLAGSGPRWLGAVADLAAVAYEVGNRDAAEELYAALLPYDGRLVVWGGANTVSGPVGFYLGLLAVSLGRADDAVAHLNRALEMCERNGSLPAVARLLAVRAKAYDMRGDAMLAAADQRRSQSLVERLGMRLIATPAQSPDEWSMRRDGDDWLIDAGTEHLRMRDVRGLHYLAALVAAPGLDVEALDLVADGAGLRAGPAEPLLDDAGRAAYRRRLDALAEQLDAADRTGDQHRAADLAAERDTLITALRQASGLAGRRRAMPDEAERARVNVTRTLRTTIERISVSAPALGAHLNASVRTGRLCRYQPAPGGPRRWNT